MNSNVNRGTSGISSVIGNFALALIVVTGACQKSQTDKPVVTTTGDASAVSPSGDAAAKVGTSLVRLVNAVPDERTLNVTGDDKPVFDNVVYKNVTSYAEVRDNMMDFRLRAAGHDSVLADNKETMADGNRYTIVAMKDADGKAMLKVMKDEVVPDAGKARVRVINAVPGLDDVKVRLSGQKDDLFGDVDFSNEAGYKDIDPVDASVEVIRKDGDSRALTIKNRKFEAGKSYTILLTGKKGGKVESIMFDDAVTTTTR